MKLSQSMLVTTRFFPKEITCSLVQFPDAVMLLMVGKVEPMEVMSLPCGLGGIMLGSEQFVQFSVVYIIRK